MAFKDRFEKLISYFDTDDANELEELVADLPPVTGANGQGPEPNPVLNRPSRPTESDRVAAQPIAPKASPTSVASSRPAQRPTQEPSARTGTELRERVSHQKAPLATQQVTTSQGQTTIALKYPRRYEDAPAIVDLLINNECVLIDFEYMLDAQARRCLDFLDGASRVLYGSLQKVGATMYLLAPANVVVNIEEILAPVQQQAQESSYNYDMKRR